MKKPPEMCIDKNKLQIKKKGRWRTVGFIDEYSKVTIWFQGRCTLCGELVPVGKTANKHHISYPDNIMIFLCYTCHNIFHWRLCFKTNYWKNYFNHYGDDAGAYFLCKKILKLFNQNPRVMANIKRRFPDDTVTG